MNPQNARPSHPSLDQASSISALQEVTASHASAHSRASERLYQIAAVTAGAFLLVSLL